MNDAQRQSLDKLQRKHGMENIAYVDVDDESDTVAVSIDGGRDLADILPDGDVKWVNH